MTEMNGTTNTDNASCHILPESSLFNFPLANAIRQLDCQHLSEEQLLELAFGCEDAVSGLNQMLKFLGDSLISLCTEEETTFSTDSVSQLGHSLHCIGELIPALNQLSSIADARLIATH